MSTQQWEIGHGRVWSFTASEVVTSGDVVKFTTDNKIRSTQAGTDVPIGVVLFPASEGKLAAVALDMVVYVNITGASIPSNGSYVVPASAGKATQYTMASDVGNLHILGRCLETTTTDPTRNTRAKIKLIW